MNTPHFQVWQGDCLDRLRRMKSDTIPAIVTDPPYGLEFMGRAWDKTLPDPQIWGELLRVAKPGAHAVIFGAPRLYHRLAVAVEDAGWEVRDCLMWIFGSGFPKSHNMAPAMDKMAGAMGHRGAGFNHAAWGSQASMDGAPGAHGPHTGITPAAQFWAGWGTALKPAYEPILLVRKPFPGPVAANVLAHGTGAINVDAARVPSSADERQIMDNRSGAGYGSGLTVGAHMGRKPGEVFKSHAAGRWPANVAMDPEAGAILDLQSGDRPVSGSAKAGKKSKAPHLGSLTYGRGLHGNGELHADSGGASRFFYCAKASKAEREAGLEGFAPALVGDGRHVPADNAYQRGATLRKNTHPTVKPIELIRWLVRLITPPVEVGGFVFDPFTGSGSHGAAAVLEGFPFLGIERDPEYVRLAMARITHWAGRRAAA